MIFVVLVVVVGGAAYRVLSGSDEDSGGKSGKQAAASVKPSEIEVAVLNGTSVAGLAATYGDKVEGKGFRLGAVTNTDQPSKRASSCSNAATSRRRARSPSSCRSASCS